MHTSTPLGMTQVAVNQAIVISSGVEKSKFTEQLIYKHIIYFAPKRMYQSRFIPIFTILLILFSCEKEQNSSERTIHLLLGNPSNATSSISNSENFLIEKKQYCLSYNNSKHIANWVSWHLSKEDLGQANRTNYFKSDSTLPPNWYQVKYADYTNSGFDRGHLCPSADRTSNDADNSATFLMTNIVPQAPKINSYTWLQLESYCRKIVNEGSELYIITGTYGRGGTGGNGFADSIRHNIIVPSELWKIVVVLPQGTNDLNRINVTTRVIAVLIPNDQSASNKSWTSYRVTINKIEDITGFDFLSNVPAPIQDILEQRTDSIE